RRAGIAPSQLFTWKRRMLEGGATAVQADDDVVGAARVRELEKRVRDPERMLGKKTMEVEILKEALDLVTPKSPCCGSPRSARTVRCEDDCRHARRFRFQPH